MIITGFDAISYARAKGLTLGKFEDPTEPARDGLTLDEAEDVAREDPSLVYLEFRGWSTELDVEGYYAGDYFAGGEYLGPDEFGVEPVFV